MNISAFSGFGFVLAGTILFSSNQYSSVSQARSSKSHLYFHSINNSAGIPQMTTLESHKQHKITQNRFPVACCGFPMHLVTNRIYFFDDATLMTHVSAFSSEKYPFSLIYAFVTMVSCLVTILVCRYGNSVNYIASVI